MELNNRVSHLSNAVSFLHRVPGHGLVLNSWTPSFQLDLTPLMTTPLHSTASRALLVLVNHFPSG